MANDNIKRYLDYDGLAYLINKFNSVIEANEYTTSEALNDLNRKIAEININDNTGGFPIIDADITQVDSVYTTTENLNELITPGQYIVDSSKIQYEEDNFVKTLYWLLSVDKVVYDNSESIIQTYYPLSYLSYNWYNIPIGGLLQRFYEGNNTWTDLQVAAPGDVDPSKFVTKNKFNTEVQSINISINNINEEIDNINETIEGLNKTDNDTKCETGTINAGTSSEAPTEGEVSVVSNAQVDLSGDGSSLTGSFIAVNVVTKQYVDKNCISKSENASIWEAINSGRVDSITLEKSGTKVTKDNEEVDVPYINNKISFTEGLAGSFSGKFDVISLPTKKYVINNYVDKTSFNNYVKDVVNNNIIDIANFKSINIPLSTKEGLEIQDGKAIIGTNILDLSTVLDQKVRNIHSTSSDSDYNEYTDLSIILNNSVNKTYLKDGEEYPTLYSLSESLSIGYYDVSKNKNVRIGSFYTYDSTGRAQGRFDLDAELCVHDDDNKAYLIFEHNNNSAESDDNDPRSTVRHIKRDENNKIIEDISFNSLFSVNSERQIFVTDHFSIKDRNYNSDKQDNFSDPYEYSDLFNITDIASNFYVPLYVNNSQVLTSSNISNNLPSTVITTSNIASKLPNTVITTSNIASKLPSTVITTSNISNYSSKSSEYIKVDNVNNINEYYNCAYFIAGNSTNINKGTGPEPNKIYQPKYTPLENFINGTASGNPIGAFVSNMAWTSTLRLFFNSKYFYDVQFDPNNENIIHRLVCNGTSKPWHLLLDSNNYNEFFKISNLTPKSLTVTNNINVGGGVFETSDETLKDFQDSIQVNFKQLKEIPKAYFTFKDDKTGETKIGTSAQKVKEFYPELVSEDENGILSVDYAKLSIIALKAVDDLDDRLTKLEKLVEQLINK